MQYSLVSDTTKPNIQNYSFHIHVHCILWQYIHCYFFLTAFIVFPFFLYEYLFDLGTHSISNWILYCRHVLEMLKAMPCNSRFILPHTAIFSTPWLSVNHLVLRHDNFGVSDFNTKSTALSSLHVLLLQDSLLSHIPWAKILPVLTI